MALEYGDPLMLARTVNRSASIAYSRVTQENFAFMFSRNRA